MHIKTQTGRLKHGETNNSSKVDEETTIWSSEKDEDLDTVYDFRNFNKIIEKQYN